MITSYRDKDTERLAVGGEGSPVGAFPAVGRETFTHSRCCCVPRRPCRDQLQPFGRPERRPQGAAFYSYPGLMFDEVFLRTVSSGAQALLADESGSTLATIDSNGTIQNQFAYEPFGRTTTPSDLNVQHTGRENDGTGLMYFRARYYSPSLQRFITQDPLEFGGGDANFYAYAANNLLQTSDPFGLWKVDGRLIYAKKYDELYVVLLWDRPFLGEATGDTYSHGKHVTNLLLDRADFGPCLWEVIFAQSGKAPCGLSPGIDVD